MPLNSLMMPRAPKEAFHRRRQGRVLAVSLPVAWCALAGVLLGALPQTRDSSSASSGASPVARLDTVVRAGATEILLADNPAIAVTVGVIHGSTRQVFAFGRVAPDSKVAPSASTIFPIGSISKTFAGVLLAQAVVEGRARLNDDVRAYLEGSYPNLAFEGRPLPLYTLLNHRSGLPRSLPLDAGDGPRSGEDIAAWVQRTNHALEQYSRAQFLRDLHAVSIAAAPNTQFGYSNAAVQLLGVVLERVSGAPIDVLLARGVTRPLGMGDTTMRLTAAQRRRAVVGLEQGRDRVPPVSAQLQLAGALHSTAADMLRYVEWHMQEGDPVTVLSHQATFTEGEYQAGLNWQMLRTSRGRLIWQDGTVPGATALCLFEPERRLGLVVLSNSSDQASGARLAAFANRILQHLSADAILLPVR